MKHNNNNVNTQEKITPPKWLQNELHAKTEPQVDKIIAAYKKEKIGFSRFSLQTLALDMAALGYYHGIPNPPEEKETAAPSIQSKEEGKHRNEKMKRYGNQLCNESGDFSFCELHGQDNHDFEANAARIVQCWNEYDGLKEENKKQAETINAFYRAFESLTPGGSEYWNDVARCIGYVREERKETKEIIKDQKSRITQLEEMNNDLQHYVGYVEDTISRGAVPRLEFEEWKEAGKPLTK